jgi:hypothetical protein
MRLWADGGRPQVNWAQIRRVRLAGHEQTRESECRQSSGAADGTCWLREVNVISRTADKPKHFFVHFAHEKHRLVGDLRDFLWL